MRKYSIASISSELRRQTTVKGFFLKFTDFAISSAFLLTNAIYFAKISAIIIGADEKEYFGAWLKRADEGARSASSTEERHFGAINFKADTYVSSRVEPRVILVPADIVGRVFYVKV